jgi:hypothetical protein
LLAQPDKVKKRTYENIHGFAEKELPDEPAA